MLIRLRMLLGVRRTGTLVLWGVVVLLTAPVLGHASVDAATHSHDEVASPIAGAVAGDSAGDHDDGHQGTLGCSIGDALCALGIAFGTLLLRRAGTTPYRAVWRVRGAEVPIAAGWTRVTTPPRPPVPTRLVRLQI